MKTKIYTYFIFITLLAYTITIPVEDFKPKITFDDKELKSRLSKLEYKVTQKGHVEDPNTGRYTAEEREGLYKCIVCDELKFTSLDRRPIIWHRPAWTYWTRANKVLDYLNYIPYVNDEIIVDGWPRFNNANGVVQVEKTEKRRY